MRALLFALVLLFLPASQAAERQAGACFGCHGKAGRSETPLTPSLAGQPSFFVVAQLFLFRDGRRGKAPTPMDAFAKKLTDDDLRAYGELFAKLAPPAPPAGTPDAEKFNRGKRLLASRKCTVCHNPDFSGREQMPRLANQREDYLLKAMRDYVSGQRIGYGGATMPEELAGMSDADLQGIAHYLAYLPKGR